jgi:murein DD-endopeptidase MepM/ murein hydrolase activator NlpD
MTMSPAAPKRPAAFGKSGSWIVFAASMGFLAGMLVMAALVTVFPGGVAAAADPFVQAAPHKVEVKPTKRSEPPPISPPSTAVAPPAPVEAGMEVDELRARGLTLPVQGIKREQLQDTFNDTRGTSRKHEALDILAPRNTPVFAVEDGKVAKLFLSDAGGITIYQFDPTANYAYYYAHLERYADGLKEGDQITRGQVIGYVGTTGNAPRDTPHLHFAIFKLTSDKHWWQGTPIDPYSVLR